MNEEQTLLRHLVLLLLRRHEQWLRQALEAELRLYSEILERYPNPFTSDELEQVLAHETERFCTRNRFLFLEPIHEGGLIIPILTMWYDFRKDIPDVSFQLGLFSKGDKSLVALGLRFEVPGGTGVHNYYHAQPVHVLVRNAGLQLPPPPWPSTSWPTFPMNAVNVVTLLICAVVSLYGRRYLDALIGDPSRSQLQRYMKDLHWIDPQPGKQSRFQQDGDGRWRWST